MFNNFIIASFTALAALCSQGPVASAKPAAQSTVHHPTSVSGYCCKICTIGKACGDSCISRYKDCNVGPGCACDGVAPTYFTPAMGVKALPLDAPITVTIRDPVCLNNRNTLFHVKKCRYYYSSCALIERAAAVRLGARPCKVCGG